MKRALYGVVVVCGGLVSANAADFRYDVDVRVLQLNAIQADGTVDIDRLWLTGIPKGLHTRELYLDGRITASLNGATTIIGTIVCGVGDMIADRRTIYNVRSCSHDLQKKVLSGSQLTVETGFRVQQNTTNQQRSSTLMHSLTVEVANTDVKDCSQLPPLKGRGASGQHIEAKVFRLQGLPDTSTWAQNFCVLFTPRGSAVAFLSPFGSILINKGGRDIYLGSFQCGDAKRADIVLPTVTPPDQILYTSLHSCSYSPVVAGLIPSSPTKAHMGFTFDKPGLAYGRPKPVLAYPNAFNNVLTYPR